MIVNTTICCPFCGHEAALSAFGSRFVVPLGREHDLARILRCQRCGYVFAPLTISAPPATVELD
jgi:C4-type Zn-finger protein